MISSSNLSFRHQKARLVEITRTKVKLKHATHLSARSWPPVLESWIARRQTRGGRVPSAGCRGQKLGHAPRLQEKRATSMKHASDWPQREGSSRIWAEWDRSGWMLRKNVTANKNSLLIPSSINVPLTRSVSIMLREQSHRAKTKNKSQAKVKCMKKFKTNKSKVKLRKQWIIAFWETNHFYSFFVQRIGYD